MDCHFKVERLSDFSVLDSFECGVAQMDNFIHGNLKHCDANHYCSTFVVRDIINGTIAALFSLSFDSVNLNPDDFEDLSVGAAEKREWLFDETHDGIGTHQSPNAKKGLSGKVVNILYYVSVLLMCVHYCGNDPALEVPARTARGAAEV